MGILLNAMLNNDTAMDPDGILTCYSSGLFKVVAQLAQPISSKIILVT